MRRIAILLATVMLTSGCLSNVGDTINPEKEIFQDTIFINEDEHMKLTWTTDSVRTIRINLDLLEGPNIDLYTMSETNYESYKNCEAFNYIVQLSDPDTSGVNIEVNTDAGTYVTVIDNTDCGEAQPPDQSSTIPPSSDENDRARVEYKITAQ